MKCISVSEIPKGMPILHLKEMLHHFARSGESIFQLAAAAHPHSPEKTFVHLARYSTSLAVLSELSKRNDLPEKAMLGLVGNRFYPKENFLKRSEILSAGVALKLVRMSNRAMHDEIARAKNIPKKALEELAVTANFSVVISMAKYSPNFDEDLLDIAIRRADIDNVSISGENESNRSLLYINLASNGNIVMRESLQMRIINDSFSLSEKKHLEKLAARVDLSQRTIDFLANCREKNVQKILHRNKKVKSFIKK